MTADGGSRLYELRVPSLPDARVRDAVATTLDRWVPAQGTPALIQALSRNGFATRLPLGDAQASALLRDLYATGVTPASVVLRPLGVGAPSRPAAQDPTFAIFADHGGRFVPTWNWGAFVFGPLWYFRRGLYAKGLVLFALSVCPLWSLAITVLMSLVILVYCGVAGNWDDYLWKAKGTQWW